jgi:hypothetical protein
MSAVFGLSHGIVDQVENSCWIVAVIGSALIPSGQIDSSVSQIQEHTESPIA